MPRYYRRRYTRTLVKPKKKWASNITIWNHQGVSTPYTVTLVKNASQTDVPTPAILKVGNFKISCDMVAGYSSAQTMASIVANCFIVFVPEGITDGSISTMLTQHPEYILAAKVSGGSAGTGQVLSLDTLNLSTRLKRNLNSGDRVVLYMSFSGSSSPEAVYLTGSVRYWCCNN